MNTVYADRKGRLWILVAHTRSGVVAWFRPVEHADDGYYDKAFKLSALRAAGAQS